MECILFRHGIAVDREEWEGQEDHRPLTPKGVEKTREAAVGLSCSDVVPSHLVSSPFVRALDTAKILREVFKFHDDVQLCDALLPDASPDQLVTWLAGLPKDACALCVGHEPNLGEAAGFMLSGSTASGFSLKKAGAGAIWFDEKPKPGEGVLRWWLMPSQLRMMGKNERGRRRKGGR